MFEESFYQSVIDYVDFLIDSGKYMPDIPKFQTDSNLHNEPLFKPLVEQALSEAEPYRVHFRSTEGFIAVNQLWCYVDYADAYEFYERRSAWHTHGDCLTGVMYLKNDEAIGTEFPDGSYFAAEPRQWIFMDGFEFHRPPVPRTNSRRYTLGINVVFYQGVNP